MNSIVISKTDKSRNSSVTYHLETQRPEGEERAKRVESGGLPWGLFDYFKCLYTILLKLKIKSAQSLARACVSVWPERVHLPEPCLCPPRHRNSDMHLPAVQEPGARSAGGVLGPEALDLKPRRSDTHIPYRMCRKKSGKEETDRVG